MIFVAFMLVDVFPVLPPRSSDTSLALRCCAQQRLFVVRMPAHLQGHQLVSLQRSLVNSCCCALFRFSRSVADFCCGTVASGCSCCAFLGSSRERLFVLHGQRVDLVIHLPIKQQRDVMCPLAPCVQLRWLPLAMPGRSCTLSGVSLPTSS